MHAPHCDASQRQTAQTIATNVRRLMARDGLTFSDVVETTGLDERTVAAWSAAPTTPTHGRCTNSPTASASRSTNCFSRPALRRRGRHSIGPPIRSWKASLSRTRRCSTPGRRPTSTSSTANSAPAARSTKRASSPRPKRSTPSATLPTGLRHSRKRRIGTAGRLCQAALSTRN